MTKKRQLGAGGTRRNERNQLIERHTKNRGKFDCSSPDRGISMGASPSPLVEKSREKNHANHGKEPYCQNLRDGTATWKIVKRKRRERGGG